LDCKLHVSTSLRNPRKAYWRCDACKIFDWVGPKNMVWTGGGEAPLSGGRIEDGSINQMEQQLVALKGIVADIGVSIKELSRFGLIMFCAVNSYCEVVIGVMLNFLGVRVMGNVGLLGVRLMGYDEFLGVRLLGSSGSSYCGR